MVSHEYGMIVDIPAVDRVCLVCMVAKWNVSQSRQQEESGRDARVSRVEDSDSDEQDGDIEQVRMSKDRLIKIQRWLFFSSTRI
jgi:hypothetical protein